jgi:hypothetical protein
MKVKKCPSRKFCFDYKDNNCDNCEFGKEFTKLHKQIDRLKKQNETLTIQRNAWALTAKAIAREIFTDIEFDIQQLDFDREETRAIAIEGVIANIKKKYIPQECPTCKSFVGCEQANWTGPCDDYKEENQ